MVVRARPRVCAGARWIRRSGTESHRSQGISISQGTKRYSVVEFPGLVQVQMSPQGRTLRGHRNRRPDVQKSKNVAVPGYFAERRYRLLNLDVSHDVSAAPTAGGPTKSNSG